MADNEVRLTLRVDDSKLQGDLKKTEAHFKKSAKAVSDEYKGVINRPGTKDFENQSTLPGAGNTPWGTTAGGTGAAFNAAKNRRRLMAEEIRAARAGGLRGWGYGPAPGSGGGGGGGVPPVIPGGGGGGGGGATPPPNTPAGMFHNLMNFQMSPLGVVLTKVAAAVVAFRVALGLVRFAVNLALIPIRMIAHAFVQAAESARALYARALQSGGLPMGFIAKRSALASVIGVGENEVMQYGRAIGYLNEQLDFSARIHSETNAELTSAAWSMRVLKEDFKALVAVMAVELAPVVRQFASALHQLGPVLKAAAWLWGKQIKMGMTAGLGLVGAAAQLFGKDKGPAPAPSVSTQRLPGSAWEKMGLVIGGGGGSNWAEMTAHNTRRLNNQIEGLRADVRALGGGDMTHLSASYGGGSQKL